jgi:arylsulfatase A-like enzyme
LRLALGVAQGQRGLAMTTRVSTLLRLAFLSLAVLVAAGASQQPNLLWLTSEDHGPEMGCYGDANARTPAIDALAAKGMIFRRVWSNHPVCAPARSAIISGLYSESSGALHMRSMVPMPAGARMFPEYLREAGYYCANNVKEDYSLPKTAATWDDSSAKAHWQARRQGQPFFAVFNSTRSHESQIRRRPHTPVADPARMRVPAYHPDTAEVRRDWAQYYDGVSAADADAGARLKELEEAGLAEDTIVFYYGDHGSGMPRSKRWPSNSGLHVPLVVYFPPKWRHLAPPDYRPGGASDRLVSFVDLAPTMLSLAGVKPPAWMQGSAFAGEHRGPAPEFLFGARGRMDERHDQVRSVTDGRYVYLRNFQPHLSQGQRVAFQLETPTTRQWMDWHQQGRTNDAQAIFWRTPKAVEELYDLANDRDEVRNLALSESHRALLERLRGALRSHQLAVRDVVLLPESELHSRAPTVAPYDLARQPDFPFERILETAERASDLRLADTAWLSERLGDPDSAIRYWAALGLRMRAPEGVRGELAALRRALGDQSPEVRIVASEALARDGEPADRVRALAILGELAPPATSGVLVSMPALRAIDDLGPLGVPLHASLTGLDPKGPMPDRRYDSYVPRLLAWILGQKAP